MRKTFVVAFVALLVAGVGGYLGFTAFVAHLARSHVDAVLANLKAGGVDAQAGTVSYDVIAGRFELHDLSLSAPGQGTLKIASFVADGVERPSPTRIFAHDVAIEGIAFDGPLPLAPAVEASYRAPRIELAAVEIPATEPAPGTPWQVAMDVFEKVTTDRVSIPGSTVRTTSGTGDQRIETEVMHGAATFEMLKDGRFARASVAPSRFTVGGAPRYAGSGSVGDILAEEVDLSALLILLDPERREAATQFRTLYGAVTVAGYDIAAGDGLKQSWERLELRDVAIRPSAIPAEELFALGRQMQALAARGEKLPPADAARLMEALASIYDGGLRVGSATFEGLRGAMPDGGTATLATLKAGPFDEGRLDTLTLEKLKGTEPGGAPFRLDRLAVGGLRPGAALTLAAQITHEPDALLEWPASLFGLVGTIELDGAEGPTGSGEPVSIDRLALSWTGEPDALPTRLSASLRMTGPTGAVDPNQSAFALVPGQVGRASIAADIGAAWNEAAGTATLDPFYVEVSDAFSVTAKLSLSEVDDSVFSTEPDEAMAGIGHVNLAGLDITVTDSGLYQEKLDDAAKEQGMSADDIRQLIAGFADLLLAQAVTDRPELGPAVQAFVDFVQHPGSTLALRITPRAGPLPMLAIVEALTGADALGIVDELNVEVIGKN
ncbi:hypothetical protein MWN33_12150 [Starkeya koreensis]|uniref:DUF945 domain-containing protein n=1 Tax=Ancylobacter koreensis TaxID=266121 RepID=A0ABT0DND4_9HYPH|nr:hypothetical protein [Ancylobacter koreensis]MCK0208781.1 hypothetical protein [Ancylobacter koreensis]